MLVLTQTLRDACIAEEDVKPLGFIIVLGPISEGRTAAATGVCERIKENHKIAGPLLIVNVALKFYVYGHPSNNSWECELTGDLYRPLSLDLREKCDL